MQPLIQSTRHFQVWLYTVSHAQLLLRANPRSDGDERIEVLFKAVRWMSLPTLLQGLTVQEIDHDSAHAIFVNLGEAPFLDRIGGAPAGTVDREDRVFLVKGNGYEGVVVALGAFVHRDNLPDSEPSGFYEHNLSIGAHLRP